ncbi:hypothetical protein V8E52_004279 [Russula decolorans]
MFKLTPDSLLPSTMVPWFHGPLILENRYLVDTSGFIIEFDAAVCVNTFKESMKCKLRLDNICRYCFTPGSSCPVVATVLFARLLPDFSDRVRETNFTKLGEQFLLFGDIISMVLLPTAPPHKMQQKPLVVLSGTVSSAVSTSLTKVFFIHAYQELTNFLEWDYLRVSDHTKITIRAAINLRRFNGNTDAPARTHVLI